MLLLEKYVKRGRRTASRIWGKTAIVVILPLKASRLVEGIFELTPVGTYIWKLLGNKCKLKEVVSQYSKKKKIRRALATREVVSFIKKLAARKIVDISDEQPEE